MDDLFRKRLEKMMDRIMYDFGDCGVCLVVVRNVGNDQRIEFSSNMGVDDVMEVFGLLVKGNDPGVEVIVP